MTSQTTAAVTKKPANVQPTQTPVKAAAKATAAAKTGAVTKPARPTGATPAATPAASPPKPAKPKKPKLVRDSFTIPKLEYGVLEELKQRIGKLGSSAKKSELLRAGIKALAAMPDPALLLALKAVPMIKTGRPARD